MGKTITQKLIEAHLVSGRIEPGSEIGIRIDQTLTQDATGTMAYLQFEAMGIAACATELSVSYIDHNTIQIGFENADDHRYLQSVARQIRHPSLPGRKRHLPPGPSGAVRQARKDAPGLRQPYPHRRRPGHDRHRRGRPRRGAGHGRRAVLPHLPEGDPGQSHGQTPPWVSAKDIILKVLEIFTTKGNVGHDLRIRRRGPRDSHRARAGHDRQHGRRDAA